MNAQRKIADSKSGNDPPRYELRLDGILDDLKALSRWVCWRWQPKGDKWTKVPIRSENLRNASTTAPATWGTFDRAATASKRESVAGVGFVLGDGIAGADLDKCRDPATGEIAPWAMEFLRLLDSYSEVSPSETGVKVLVRAACPGGKGRKRDYQGGAVEAYSEARFFTMTGQQLDGFPTVPMERQEQFVKVMCWAGLLKDVATHRKQRKGQDAALQPGELRSKTGDAELPQSMFGAKNGDKARSLWDGDWSGYDSQSSADLALMSLLWHWAEGDRDRTRSLFLVSGLGEREKAGREDYLDRTLDKAMEGDDGASAAPAGFDAGGGFALHLGKPYKTASGTIKGQVEIRRDGKAVDVVALSSTNGGRDAFAKALKRHLPEDCDGDMLASTMLLAAKRRLEEADAKGGEGTLHTLLAVRVPQMLGIAFRSPKGVWSEARGAEMSRGDFVTFTPDELLDEASTCANAPPSRPDLVRMVGVELGVVWAGLLQRLPDEVGANLDKGSRRAGELRRALLALWTHSLIFEVDRSLDGGGLGHAARSTLAYRARRLRAKVDPKALPTGKWVAVKDAFDAFICLTKTNGVPRVLLGMQARLASQVGVKVPGVSDDDAVPRCLGMRYGLLEAAPPVQCFLEDGRTFAVLESSITAEILAQPLAELDGRSEAQ